MSRTQEEFMKAILGELSSEYNGASKEVIEGYIAQETAKYMMEQTGSKLDPAILECFGMGSEIAVKNLLEESVKVIGSNSEKNGQGDGRL